MLTSNILLFAFFAVVLIGAVQVMLSADLNRMLGQLPHNLVILFFALVLIGLANLLPEGSTPMKMLGDLWIIIVVLLKAGNSIMPSDTTTTTKTTSTATTDSTATEIDTAAKEAKE